ncbi:hypothetical protein E2C01_102831 [Portunus trituberculatus]|uniref:Uncharacterized protein n=1 Tax=Portunus trituberculatus TaxID=210409 RepID=A0A5B7KDK9_PORTR|nr:hypothetical protein [Portunus trituberculatus]
MFIVIYLRYTKLVWSIRSLKWRITSLGIEAPDRPQLTRKRQTRLQVLSCSLVLVGMILV